MSSIYEEIVKKISQLVIFFFEKGEDVKRILEVNRQ